VRRSATRPCSGATMAGSTTNTIGVQRGSRRTKIRLGLGVRRGPGARSRCPTCRCSGRRPVNSRSKFNEPGPRGLSNEAWPPRGPGSGTIDHHLRPSPLNGKAFDKRDRAWGAGVLAAKTISARPGFGCRPTAIRSGEAAVPRILGRLRRASIAGIAPKERCLRRRNRRGTGCALAPTSVASAPTSPPGRLISRARFRGNAVAGARTPDLGDHRRLSTNQASVPAEIISACGAISAARISKA
jgi:hypothetical protein